MERKRLTKIIANLNVSDTLDELSDYLEMHAPGGAKIHNMRQFLSRTNIELTNFELEGYSNLTFKKYREKSQKGYNNFVDKILLKAINKYNYKI